MPAAEANQHDEQGADHEEVACKAEAGLAGDEAKEPDQGKENEDPAANPAQDKILGDIHYFSSFQLFSLFMINYFFQAGFLLAKIRRILPVKRVNAAENWPDSAIILLKVCNMAGKKS